MPAPNYTDLITETFKQTIPIALDIQNRLDTAIHNDKSHFEYDGEWVAIKPEVKGDDSPVTIADKKVQRIGLTYLQHELEKFGKVYVKAEEDGVTQPHSEDECRFRIIYDPIDGTGNYSGVNAAGGRPQRGNTEETPEIDNHIGWGSMLVIQERKNDQWITVAAGIYESTPKDTGVTEPQGRVFLADESSAWQTTLADPSVKTPLKNEQNAPRKRFVDSFVYPEIKEQMNGVSAASKDEEMNLNCVAQGGIGMFTGKCKELYLQHPYLHDVAPVAFIAEKAGYHVAIMPRFADAHGGEKHPMIITDNEQILATLAGAYTVKARATETENEHFKQSGTVLNGDMSVSALDKSLNTTGWAAALNEQRSNKFDYPQVY